MRRVVITGVGALTPIGNNIPQYLEGLRNGVSGAGPITRFDATNFKTQFACEVKNFNADEFIDKKEVRRLDDFAIYAIVAADEAIAQAGLNPEKLDLDRVGVIISSGIGGLATLEKEVEDFTTGNGIPRYNPFLIPKMIIDIASGHVSMKYGFRGINYAIVSA
jgi:3-oxoacyl-[acyl-carrier-protein] synthase II